MPWLMYEIVKKIVDFWLYILSLLAKWKKCICSDVTETRDIILTQKKPRLEVRNEK